MKNEEDLTEDEKIALSYIAPNLACIIEREPPRAAEETRRLARQELSWIVRKAVITRGRDPAVRSIEELPGVEEHNAKVAARPFEAPKKPSPSTRPSGQLLSPLDGCCMWAQCGNVAVAFNGSLRLCAVHTEYVDLPEVIGDPPEKLEIPDDVEVRLEPNGSLSVSATRPHLINGEFQSDKYPTTPRGKVPLSVKDVTAQDLLWEYAQRRRAVDAEFADDLEEALRIAGYHRVPRDPMCGCGRPSTHESGWCGTQCDKVILIR